jgi:hypothetical protein
MKKWICMIAMALASIIQLSAQGRAGEGMQRVQAMKVAFITQRMNLTPEEAEKFWPLQNEFEAEQRKIRTQYRPGNNLSTLSDAAIEEAILNLFEMEEQITRLKRNYFNRFKRVVPVRKLAIYYRAETDFNKRLLQSLQQTNKRD